MMTRSTNAAAARMYEQTNGTGGISDSYRNATMEAMKAAGANETEMAAERPVDPVTGVPLYPATRSVNSQLKDSNVDHQLLNDETYAWEDAAIYSMRFFPHHPFCELAVLCFSNSKTSEVLEQYFLQVFDFFILLFIICSIEKVWSINKIFKLWKQDEEHKPYKALKT